MATSDRGTTRGQAGAFARLSTAAFGVALSLLVAGCGATAAASVAAPAPTVAATPTDTPPVATSAVAIKNFAFGPVAVTVPVGTAVTWTNDDIEEHTVTANDKSFDSGAVENTKNFTFTFSKVGTYRYYCAIHPYMVGTVVVTAK